jgi:hypothetical protein
MTNPTPPAAKPGCMHGLTAQFSDTLTRNRVHICACTPSLDRHAEHDIMHKQTHVEFCLKIASEFESLKLTWSQAAPSQLCETWLAGAVELTRASQAGPTGRLGPALASLRPSLRSPPPSSPSPQPHPPTEQRSTFPHPAPPGDIGSEKKKSVNIILVCTFLFTIYHVKWAKQNVKFKKMPLEMKNVFTFWGLSGGIFPWTCFCEGFPPHNARTPWHKTHGVRHLDLGWTKKRARLRRYFMMCQRSWVRTGNSTVAKTKSGGCVKYKSEVRVQQVERR